MNLAKLEEGRAALQMAFTRRELTPDQIAFAKKVIAEWRSEPPVEDDVAVWTKLARTYWVSLDRDEWIAEARRHFSPGKREPCRICHRYRSLTQAHHVVPLFIQLELGHIEPDQNFVWLCPTHHAAIHALFSSGRKLTEQEIGRAAVSLINDLNGHIEELRALLDLYRMGAGAEQ